MAVNAIRTILLQSTELFQRDFKVRQNVLDQTEQIEVNIPLTSYAFAVKKNMLEHQSIKLHMSV